MANISGQGSPGYNTQGSVGDIYVDTITGKSYELVYIYEITGFNGKRIEYDWDIVKSESGGGGDISGEQLVSNPIVNGKISLTKDKYQITELNSNAEILLPEVDGFSEIHLFVSVKGEFTLTFPNVKCQNEVELVPENLYEIIFTHTSEWFFGCIEYTAK